MQKLEAEAGLRWLKPASFGPRLRVSNALFRVERTSDFELMRLARTAGLLYSEKLVDKLVGMRRFELRAPASQTQCSDLTELHTGNW